MGLKSFVMDRLANVMSGQGTTIDRRTAALHVFNPLTDEQAEAAYRSSWLVKKICDLPPLDMTREWRDWQADDKQIEAIEKEERRLQLQPKCKRALILSRIYGGGMLLLGASGNPETELKPERIGKDGLRYVRVMSPRQMTIGEQRLDPEDPFVDQPLYYELSAMAGRKVRIHPSRVIAFVGQRAPEGAVYSGTSWFWGDPVLQAIGDAVQHAEMAQGGFASLIDEAKLDIIRMPGLTDLASTDEGEQRIINRLSATAVGKSTWRALLLDSEDEWDQRQITWAGIPDVMMSFLEIVAGAADIPVTRLLGQSPKGLQSTGDGEERDYHAMVRAQQDEILLPALERIDELLIRSALGSRPEEIYFDFGPLSELSEKDASAVDKQTADTFKVYGDTGLIHEEALAEIARNKMIETGRFPGCEAAFDAVNNALAEKPDPVEEAAAIAAAKMGVAPPAPAGQPPNGSKKKVAANDFNPNHVQHGEHGGEFTSASGTAGGNVRKLDEKTKAEMAKANEGKDVDTLRMEAAINQVELRKLGLDMEKSLGATFAEPPPGFEVKSAASINRKVNDEDYDGPHQLRDISRASFVVSSPAQADAVVGALGSRGQIFDRGWTPEKTTGYLGRFIYLQHPNGGVSEIQLVPQGVAQIKMGNDLHSNGAGHTLYEVIRKPGLPMEAREAAARKSRTLYHRAMPKAFYAIARY